MTQITRTFLALAAFAVLVWALIAVPGWFGHAPGVRSAAAAAGYNNRVAHLVAVVWLAAMVALAYATARPGPVAADRADTVRGRANLLLPVLVVLATTLLYFPPALAWRGPFFEEAIHITLLHRMFGGDVPFRDFEFLYGPLMLFLPWLWTRATSLTMTSYYSYILILELVTLLLLLVPVQRHISRFWPRLGAYLLLAALYFNTMLGPNQNGLRKLLGVLILMGVAANPFRPIWWLVHGVALGLLLGYSQEFGAATAIGIAAIYAALLVKRRDLRAVPALGAIAATSLAVWIGSIWLFLRADLGAYFSNLRYLTAQFDAGEAAFAYYWTVNGLAAFALLALAAWLAGGALKQRWEAGPGQGDLLVIGGLAYAAVALKSGLSRADQWHLDPTVLVLCFAFVLPLPRRYLALAQPLRVAGVALVALLAATYAFGELRIARLTFYEGTFGGLTAWAGQDRQPCTLAAAPVLPAMVCQNGAPDADYVALTARLAAPDLRGRPVFVYGGPSMLPAITGTRRAGYLTDEFIYGDTRASQVQASLAASPDVLVAMTQDNFDWLAKGPDAPLPKAAFVMSGSPAMRHILGLVSSVHHSQLQAERDAQTGRWRTLIGNWVIANYHPRVTIGRIVILERNMVASG